MSEIDVTQIRVNNRSVGIIGLRSTLEDLAEGYVQRSDEEVQVELVERLSRANYIPDQVKEDYGKALLLEFKKFLGQPYEKETSEGIEIKVLGAGCSQCNQLEQNVMALVAEMNLVADVSHITDIKEIGAYGVMGTPALVINGKVVCVGKTPTTAEIKAWLGDIA